MEDDAPLPGDVHLVVELAGGGVEEGVDVVDQGGFDRAVEDDVVPRGGGHAAPHFAVFFPFGVVKDVDFLVEFAGPFSGGEEEGVGGGVGAGGGSRGVEDVEEFDWPHVAVLVG